MALSQNHARRRGHRLRRSFFLVLLPLLLTSCIPESFAAPAFDRQASDAASTLAAAGTTIEFLHEGKLDERYTKASMVIYREMLRGVTGTLPELTGAPDDAALQPVLADLRQAQDVMDHPCLDDEEGCDWAGQVDLLAQVSGELLELTA